MAKRGATPTPKDSGRQRQCQTCQGKGQKDGRSCDACHGSGFIDLGTI